MSVLLPFSVVHICHSSKANSAQRVVETVTTNSQRCRNPELSLWPGKVGPRVLIRELQAPQNKRASYKP